MVLKSVLGKLSLLLLMVFTLIYVWMIFQSRGISDLAVENSAFCVSIPMFGMIESLNLGTTSGIVLYEVTKQRREYQEKYKRANRSD